MGSWRKLGERPRYSGWRTIVGRTYELPDGSVHEFDVKIEGPTAGVVALTPEREVVLVEEFRPGVEDYLLELPGGAVDEGESPAEAAERELLEETGYAGELVPAGSMVDCAYSTRVRHAFAVVNARKVQEPQPQPGEAPRVRLVSVEEFRRHLRTGRISDVGPAYFALDALGLL
jgi:ADP-ribose pyrophosphatase